MGPPTAFSCCFRWDLRQGILAFAHVLLATALARTIAAVVLTWSEGNAFFLLLIGAALTAMCGWACLRATRDYRAVLGWSPRIREASVMAVGLAIGSAVVDSAGFVYLISWGAIHGKSDGVLAYVAVQQTIMMTLESYLIYVSWSYYQRLVTYQSVIPEQRNLPPPATTTAYPSSNFSPTAPVVVNTAALAAKEVIALPPKVEESLEYSETTKDADEPVLVLNRIPANSESADFHDVQLTLVAHKPQEGAAIFLEEKEEVEENTESPMHSIELRAEPQDNAVASSSTEYHESDIDVVAVGIEKNPDPS